MNSIKTRFPAFKYQTQSVLLQHMTSKHWFNFSIKPILSTKARKVLMKYK